MFFCRHGTRHVTDCPASRLTPKGALNVPKYYAPNPPKSSNLGPPRPNVTPASSRHDPINPEQLLGQKSAADDEDIIRGRPEPVPAINENDIKKL
jgi:hypothetical protein